jgi:hypothetical protein
MLFLCIKKKKLMKQAIKKVELKSENWGQAWWLMSAILTIWEAEIGSITLRPAQGKIW